MLITHERDKLVNAILYFAHETKHFGKIKLFKLLYLLDFEHFRQTGRSVTGLDYQAWKYGPVPVEVMQEWDDPEPDLAAAIRIKPEPVIDYVRDGRWCPWSPSTTATSPSASCASWTNWRLAIAIPFRRQ
jgi:hypothetical protein